MTYRSGAVSLAELMLVFWGFTLVLGALAGVMHGHGRLARRQAALVRVQEARRTTEVILGRELRALTAADLRREADGFGVRAVRGSGPVCSSSETSVAVRYGGVRRPDPEKDSVLLVGTRGEEALRVVGTSGGGCGSAGVVLEVDRAPAGHPVFALVFESGSYHATAGAVRYRLGRAGRQPLTEAVFSRAWLEHAGGSGVAVGLDPHQDSLPEIPGPLRILITGLNGDGS